MHPDITKLTKEQRLANDIAAYIAFPQTEDEIAFAQSHQGWPDLEDDTDWEAVCSVIVDVAQEQ